MADNTEIVFGANTIENLTTGMYKDSRVVYREYIQNACDSIDRAKADGVLKNDEGDIEISLDSRARSIEISDNGLGVPSADFRAALGNIADSDKRLGDNKGFRGIGRLAGLAYCSKLVFTSKAKGEDVESILECDAKRMRELINENNLGEKHTAQEILDEIYHFSSKPVIQDDMSERHYFVVRLEGVNEANNDLLDSSRIKDYLSFVAPVPYQPQFLFRNKVKEHASMIGYPIDEYSIFVDGEQIYKKYCCDIKNKSGERFDELHDVGFKDFYSSRDGSLLAWMWFGQSNFKGAIFKNTNPMWCLRLRKDNIQIGDEATLDQFHREDRGNRYFVGEVFCISRELIPDSQRDYFNENERRVELESQLRSYFETELYDLYRLGSKANAARKKIVKAAKDKDAFQKKEDAQEFISAEEHKEASEGVKKSNKDAVEAKEDLEKLQSKNSGNPLMASLIDRIQKETETELESAKAETRRRGNKKSEAQPGKKSKVKPRISSQKYSSFTRSERKLIAKIYDVIRSEAPKETERLIKAIEDNICE